MTRIDRLDDDDQEELRAASYMLRVTCTVTRIQLAHSSSSWLHARHGIHIGMVATL